MIDFPETEKGGEIKQETSTYKRRRPLSLPTFDLRFFAATLRSSPVDTYAATLNLKRIELGVELLNKAVEADRKRDEELCYEAYFHALDLIFSAMNADKDFDKDYLESRINCHLLKLGLSPVKSDDNGSGWRDAVIESTIAVAVAAKKSKVHQYVYTALVSIINKLRELNDRFQVSVRVVNAIESGVMLFLRLDSHLDLHQSVSEIGWTVWEAILKAAIAYAQTSSTATASAYDSSRSRTSAYSDKHAVIIKPK